MLSASQDQLSKCADSRLCYDLLQQPVAQWLLSSTVKRWQMRLQQDHAQTALQAILALSHYPTVQQVPTGRLSARSRLRSPPAGCGIPIAAAAQQHGRPHGPCLRVRVTVPSSFCRHLLCRIVPRLSAAHLVHELHSSICLNCTGCCDSIWQRRLLFWLAGRKPRL